MFLLPLYPHNHNFILKAVPGNDEYLLWLASLRFRVLMLKRGRERKQAFHNVKNQSQEKPEENGHEEEGLLRVEAPVALGGESLGLCASLLELICCRPAGGGVASTWQRVCSLRGEK